MPLNLPDPNETGNGLLQGLNTGSNLITQMIQNKLSQAQTAHALKMAQLPFGGANVSGPAGQIVGLEMLKGLYGENSPQYQQAIQAFNLSQQSTNARTNYENILSNNAPLRTLTPQGKSFVEESNLRAGSSPTGTPMGQPVVPGMPNYNPSNNPNSDANQYELHRLKQNVPSTALTSSLRGTNAEQTLNNINVDDLTQYSGIKGGMKLIKDTANAQTGIPSENYTKYHNAITNAQLLAKQYRQMMGDSITPTNQKTLDYISNPSSWILNPKVAASKFNTFADTFRRENKVFKSATQNISAYTNDNSINTPDNENSNVQTLSSLPEGTIEDTKNNHIKINGKWYKRTD